MGVTGLWRLIEPAGKPVPVETLENKVLAVDISIWLHQMVKGYQDAKGAPLPNAHLMGLFQRLCKLLYFRIKPVFVFDGGFPELKKETIAKRQDNKSKYNSESERLKRELALILGKKTAVSSLLGKQISPKKGFNAADSLDNDLFKLPAIPQRENEEDESESDDETSSGSIVDLHSVDLESDNFKTLPTKEKYDLLVELKDTRKMNSWGRLHELPKKSDNFSDFQMQRLLKRRKVQECLQETEKEMGDTGMSLNDLESLLNEEGIDTKIDAIPTRRIASNNTTRFLLINNVKQALAEAKKKKEAENNPGPIKAEEEKDVTDEDLKAPKRDELEDDLQKAIKMSLECENEAEMSACTSKTDDSWTSLMTDSDNTDSEEEDGFDQPDNLSTAKAYIMQYTDFTHKAISKIVAPKCGQKTKPNIPKVDEIIEELNNEKSIILDKVDLSSSDDDCTVTDSGSNQVSNQLSTSNQDTETSFNIDLTQASVVCVENEPELIVLDTSTEEDLTENTLSKPEIVRDKETSNETDSSDEDFEDVPEVEDFKKPIVQLTLTVGDEPDEDIFADVFATKHETIEHKIGKENTKDIKEIVGKDMKVQETEDVRVKIPENYKIQNTECKYLKVKEKEIAAINISKTVCKPINEASITSDNQEVFIEPMKNEVMNNRDVGVKIPANNMNQNSDSNIFTEVKEIEISAINTSKAVCKPICEVLTGDNQEPKKTEVVNNKDKVISNDNTNKEIIERNIESISSEVYKPSRDPISAETLNCMAEELENEEQDLLQEKGRLDRIGRNITEQMTKEAQELLQLFGIPYIVAPMEAEAQCAFLESVKLTDGTITDDSDIWLFGGKTVYKNFFNQKKHVLQFLAERIERSFNLTREQLVLLALLVGSDYTTGVTGVGPVTAMEILASFPFNKKQFLSETSKQEQYAKIVAGLQEFKQWVRAGKRTDNTTLKKKLKNVSLTDDFPSIRVVQAYMEPNIEKSEEKFTWGDLDITILRDYTKAKFGWSQNKLDEIIKPVLKRMEARSQKSIQDYFKKKVDFQSLEEHMSKRVKAAVQKMGPETPIEETAVSSKKDLPRTKTARKRKVNNKSEVNDSDTNNEAGPSKPKLKKTSEDAVLNSHNVKVVSQMEDGKSTIQINITKTDRFQEIIPQREKDKQSLLQNKMKAIELFRKTKIDRKKKPTKRRVNLPKDKAELSESSDSN